MIEQLTNQYKVTKTLRFALIPQGKTEEYFNERVLPEDEERAENYKKVKKIVDSYHVEFIEETLSKVSLEGLSEYVMIYFDDIMEKKEKVEKLKQLQESMRKEISAAFEKNEKWGILFKKELIEKELPLFLKRKKLEEEVEYVNYFKKFTTYFTGFNENRKNMYTNEEKATAISYRIINENLNKFLDNIRTFKKVKEKICSDELKENIKGAYGLGLDEVFSIDYFNLCLSQKGIDKYNEIIGGYTIQCGEKIKGINEYINLFGQKEKIKLPRMKMLYKQILSDRESFSFIPEQFGDDNETLKAIYDFYNQKNYETGKSYRTIIEEASDIIKNINSNCLDQIYIKNDSNITMISQDICGSWGTIQEKIEEEYDKNNKKNPKDIEKYLEKRRKELKKVSSYSISNLEKYLSHDTENRKLSKYLISKTETLKNNVFDNYSEVENVLQKNYDEEEKLSSDKKNVALIKNFLESLKEFQRFFGIMKGSGEEVDKDTNFYADYENFYSVIDATTLLYDKVRNYMTKKPYSEDKIKINFSNPQFLDGFDKNKEKDYLSVILRDENKYYLAIMDKKCNKIFETPKSGDAIDCYEKMNYKLLPGPNKMLPKVFLSKKGISRFEPPEELLEAYNKETHKKGADFNLNDCHRLIDYFKDCIGKHEYKDYNFTFSETNKYEDISMFYSEVSEQGYKVSFEKISKEYIESLVDKGELFLFQIYNKDFSEYSKGKENLHTMYFKALFDEINLKNTKYKLNGGAEMFYRKSSIKTKDRTIHEKNIPIKNKNELNNKKESTFSYNLIKDKRYTERQFLLHLSVTMNPKANDRATVNEEVRKIISKKNETYIIGIDRGERHLIYISVIDGKGNICEQYSLNEIANKYADQEYSTNYQNLLARKEGDREKSRKEWKTIENIKELKEGYISQVVHKICELVEKYDAIIVMEDLNSGFKNSRIKVEKSVYQKFEKMLITKLNFYVNKNKNADEVGGLFGAYQLTEKFKSFKDMTRQNGIIFYVPAWLTSKIDPVTGFTNLLYPRYESVAMSKEYISKFDGIRFNAKNNYFEFDIDCDKFPKGGVSYRKKWTICSNGERLETFRNPEKNSQWDNREIILTDEFEALFKKHEINYMGENLKEEILKMENANFFKNFIHLTKMTLQMRNSVSGTEIDYLISPIRNNKGEFYDSRKVVSDDNLPKDADANGAYNIARKGIWSIEQIKNAEDIKKVNLSISNKEWLELAQSKG